MHRELGIKISELVEWIKEMKIEMNALKEEYNVITSYSIHYTKLYEF